MQFGAIIESGLSDWQIVQQTNGFADVTVKGTYVNTQFKKPLVAIRVVNEDSNENIIYWQKAVTMPNGQWYATVEKIPAGGLYRLETCLIEDGSNVYEWAMRGDMVHHFGVGDIFVIAGQSNSSGYGKDILADAPRLGVHLLKNSGKWDIASHPFNDSTNTAHDVNTDYSNTGHSPYLSFGKTMMDSLKYPIGLLQTSLGGSSLGDWNPDENGKLYKNMISVIKSQPCGIRAVLWYQGCADCVPGACDSYYDRFLNMYSRILKDLKLKRIPILTVQLNRLEFPASEDGNRCWSKIREVQRELALQNEDVYVIPSNDCGLSDFIHNNSPANIIIGERLARIALKHLYEKNILADAPDVDKCRKINSNSILLHFINVYNRLYPFDVSASRLGITAEDENGVLGLLKYSTPSDDEILLEFDREIKGNVTVSNFYGQDPKGVVPIDYATHLPLLAFTVKAE